MRCALAFVVAALATGCATNRVDYNNNSRLLGMGMSKSEVSTVLGNPRRTDVNEDRERWIYWNAVRIGFTPIDNENLAQDRLVVTFKDGKVSRWGNQTFADDMNEATQKNLASSFKAARELQKPSN